jgi:A/G-specific adenine glycosylase
VVDYYHRFLERFPSVHALAAARLDSVLAAWSGLGYYRRARLLHEAAKQIVKDHAGRLPCSSEELRKLPGIGRYTSAAIASIAFNEPVAVVDGNVERVLARLAGKQFGGESMWTFAQQLLSRARPGDFNQAIMDLGATVCVPREPMCNVCPVHLFCATRGGLAKLMTEVRQKREIHYALGLRKGKVLLTRRSSKSTLMPGMWELPEIAPQHAGSGSSFKLRHSITVTDYLVHVAKTEAPDENGGRWISPSRISALPLTGLTRKILRSAGII